MIISLSLIKIITIKISINDTVTISTARLMLTLVAVQYFGFY